MNNFAMKIPKEFTLFGNKVTVREIDKDEQNRYGYWDDTREEIVIAHQIKTEDGVITLKQSQIESTFYHELIHSMQWYSRGSYDEIEAQTYSNLLLEFIRSSNINSNITKELLNNYD